MQICYRCEEKINERLEKMAKKKGVSKNHLMDEIIKNHLNNSWISFHEPPSRYIEREMLSGIQYANELLAQLLDELNRFQDYAENEATANTLIESLQLFRLEAIEYLLNISKILETIRKNTIGLTNPIH
ncbi:MAG: hypothetical protein Q4C61_08580 [Lachnospiraceae bacterium]|nr:hypothetical protein [Lachnospiraceae bacterium]